MSVLPSNSLTTAEKIARSWFGQIKGGGHGLMYQYAEQPSKIVRRFSRISVDHQLTDRSSSISLSQFN
jgi:hypothetical protein